MNLKLLRKLKGVSQQQLADVIGVSQQSINKYENHNIEPDIRTLISIADYFNTSVDFLIGNVDSKKEIEAVMSCDLSNDEEFLIFNYRKLNEAEKESIKLIISNYLR